MRPTAFARIALFLAAIGLALPATAARTSRLFGNYRTGEAAVRSQPLEARPNRLGHIYGNNVRRLQQRTLCVNCGKTERPMARYFYVVD